MTAEDVDTCLNNDQLLAGVQAMKTDGNQKYGVDSTPTLIVNGVRYSGIASFDAFAKIVTPLLDEAKRKKP